MRSKLFVPVVLFFLIGWGCATLPPPLPSGGKLPPRPPQELVLMIWNETPWQVNVTLSRDLLESKEIAIYPHDGYMVKLKKTGHYEYYIVGQDPQLGFTGEEKGEFNIIPGETREYRGRIAGHHLVIRQLNFDPRRPYPSRAFWGPLIIERR